MAGRVEVQVVGRQGHRAGRAVAPGDDDRVRVERARIGEGARNIDAAAFGNRRRRAGEDQGARGATLLTVVTTDELVLPPSLSVTVTVAVYRPLSAYVWLAP